MGPDFPSSADELAEPRSDMNIKVAAFTVSKNVYYTILKESNQTSCCYMYKCA